MLKKLIVFSTAYVLLILLTSCEQNAEISEEVTEQVEIKNIALKNEGTTKSAMEKISPDVLASLDVLTDYDRELNYGPDKWDEELWAWKILLKWDKSCDYGPGVSEYLLHQSQYSFIVVQCAGGAYQPISYTYLLDKDSKENIQLKLGRGLDVPELSKDIWGEIILDIETNELSILSVAVGGGSCGTYRKFNFVEGDSVKTSNFVVQTTRKQECIEGIRYEDYPESVYDFKNWPIVVDE